MNGIIDVTGVNGKVYRLRFGLPAQEMIEKRLVQNTQLIGVKTLVDLTFAGICNELIRQEKPLMSYEQVYDIIEEIAGDDELKWQVDKIYNTWAESKFGSDYLKKLDDLKKKIDLEKAQEEQKIQIHAPIGKKLKPLPLEKLV